VGNYDPAAEPFNSGPWPYPAKGPHVISTDYIRIKLLETICLNSSYRTQCLPSMSPLVLQFHDIGPFFASIVCIWSSIE